MVISWGRKGRLQLQVFGAKGLTQDTPLPDIWTHGRYLQIADGPDEVHLRSIARAEIRAMERKLGNKIGA